MTYIAFIGYNEAEFKDFKIGNKTVSICRKEDYPDPVDYIIRQSQKLGVEGETCVENLMNKILKNPNFKDFELIPTHHIPHSGDYLFINQHKGICFMLECKNKQTISYKEDLQKFEYDITNVKSVYKMNVIGIFLQVGNNKIANHECIELNENTIYLTKDYINKSCLEIVIFHYTNMMDKKNDYNEDISFIGKTIQDLENTIKSNVNEIHTLNKVVARAEHNIKSISRVIVSLNTKNEMIKKIIEIYKQSLENNNDEDYDSLDSVESIDTKPIANKNINDDIFDFPVDNNDAKSCINTNKSSDKDKLKLFEELRKLNKSPSSLTKKWLTKTFPLYLRYISANKLDNIIKDYKQYINNRK